MTKQQEMLEVLTSMSAIAAEILKNDNRANHNGEEDVTAMLTRLKAAYAAE